MQFVENNKKINNLCIDDHYLFYIYVSVVLK